MPKKFYWISIIILLLILAGLLFLFGKNKKAAAPAQVSSLHIVAAENFWGSLAAQIAGGRGTVLSIVTDPNADPHEYESNTADARAVAEADYVIENGAGYDSWIDKLLSTGGKDQRKVLNAADLLGKKAGDNPHFWYSPDYVNQVAQQIEHDFAALDPKDAQDFQNNYSALQAVLAPYQSEISQIKKNFSDVPVGATEDIFVYFAAATGVNLTTPPQFIQAVGDGNDPPASSVVIFENQIKNRQIEVLVYNVQTDTPVTENIKSLATQAGIPIVPISETVQPPTAKFQDWIGAEVSALDSALQKSAGNNAGNK